MTDLQKNEEQGRKGKAACVLPVGVIVLAAMLVAFVFNPYIFHESEGFAFSLFSYLASASLTLFLFTVSCRVRTLGFIILPIVLFCALSCWMIYQETGAFISKAVVASILETDMHEAAPYLTFTNISGVILIIGLMAAGILIGHKKLGVKCSLILMAASLVSFGVFTAISYPMGARWLKECGNVGKVQNYSQMKHMARGMVWPYRDVETVVKFVRFYYINQPKTFEAITQLPSGYVPRAEGEEPESDVIVAMMVGESVRADHWGLNGYGRDTSPLTRAWVEKGQLVSFPDTCSFGLLTRASIVGIMTDAEIGTRTPQHRPFLDILDKDGVETASLMPVDMDSDSSMIRLTQESRHKYTMDPDCFAENRLHGQTVVELRKMLEVHGQADRLFFFLYDTGAHVPYYSLPENKRFLPDEVVSPRKAKHENLVNAYDNVLLEVDWTLDAIMQELEKTGRPAVFLYVTDHGEALGEEGQFLHAMAVEPVTRPVIMVWFSSAYKEKYPERVAAIQGQLGKTISHDHIMHTVLSLFGIRRGAYKVEWDLLNPDAKGTVRPENLEDLREIKLP